MSCPWSSPLSSPLLSSSSSPQSHSTSGSATTAPRRRGGNKRRAEQATGSKPRRPIHPPASHPIPRYGEALSFFLSRPPPACRSLCYSYTNVVVDVLGQVCVACLLPLFLIPLVNALPYLVDLIIVRILPFSPVSVRPSHNHRPCWWLGFYPIQQSWAWGISELVCLVCCPGPCSWIRWSRKPELTVPSRGENWGFHIQNSGPSCQLSIVIGMSQLRSGLDFFSLIIWFGFYDHISLPAIHTHPDFLI